MIRSESNWTSRAREGMSSFDLLKGLLVQSRVIGDACYQQSGKHQVELVPSERPFTFEIVHFEAYIGGNPKPYDQQLFYVGNEKEAVFFTISAALETSRCQSLPHWDTCRRRQSPKDLFLCQDRGSSEENSRELDAGYR